MEGGTQHHGQGLAHDDGIRASLLACYICNENHSFEPIRRSKQCGIDLPTLDLVDAVVGISNCSGADTDKFAKFGLTAQRGSEVEAPLLAECHSNFECRLYDGSQISRHGLLVWEVVKAHVAAEPGIPQTVHYRGEGKFMVSGPDISRRGRFKPENL